MPGPKSISDCVNFFSSLAGIAPHLVVFPRSKTEDTLAEFRKTYARDWKFFSTDQNVEYMGHTYQGLALPRPVLRKLFHDNAVRWFPGLVSDAR